MTIKDCPECGGTHYGSLKCPMGERAKEEHRTALTAPAPALEVAPITKEWCENMARKEEGDCTTGSEETLRRAERSIKVAPDDELRLRRLAQCVNDCGGEDDDARACREDGEAAIEDLRRRLAGLVAALNSAETALDMRVGEIEQTQKALAACRDELASVEDELHKARQQPWPEWANRIWAVLQSCGFSDDGDGVDLPELLADWVEGMDEWKDADSAPKKGFFLAWSPDFPDAPTVWNAEIFHSARKPGTPRHLTANHWTLWTPLPMPAAPETAR